jgi:signal transduction histidine kinase
MALTKKGSLADVVFLPAILLSLTLMIIIGGITLYKLNEFAQSDENTVELQKTFIDDYYQKYTGVFDFGFTFMYLAIVLGTIVSAYFTRSNPLFFVAGFIIWVSSWFMLPYVANIALTLTQGISDTAIVGQSLPLMNFIYEKFVIINVVAGGAILAALYAKRGSQDLGSRLEGDSFE